MFQNHIQDFSGRIDHLLIFTLEVMGGSLSFSVCVLQPPVEAQQRLGSVQFDVQTRAWMSMSL